MNQPETLELAIAEAERTYEEQNAALEVALARLENLGSSTIQVDERELTELASSSPASAVSSGPSLIMGARC